jgi:hypothetical protein
MADKTKIQWTDATWNVARGCTKVDDDCKFCYMYRESFDSTRYNPLNVVRTKTVFAPFRKYSFESAGGCIFEQTCMKDITTVLEELEKIRKNRNGK